ncbi:MAG: 2-oxo acid dehydrogenase subunit E2 [Pseudonocardia sp.]|nr:2-oxo acid dehydrogenase subunit E2 [Pseudonocardia sp.]
MTLTREFRMPDVGEGLTEAEVVAWRVAPGDAVAINDVLVEVETAKAAVELPSPFAGTVEALLVEPRRPVRVGTPIIAIATAGAAAGPPADATEAVGQPDAAATLIGEAGPDGRIATLVGYGPRPVAARRRPRRTDPPRSPTPAAASGGLQQGGHTAIGLEQGHLAGIPVTPAAPAEPAAAPALVPLAKPPVRKLARDLGVDLHSVAGTGAGGVISRDDVRAAAAALQEGHLHTTSPHEGGLPATRPAGDEPGTRREPVRGVRRVTAAAMVASAFTAPHVTEFLAVDVTATMVLRTRLRASREYTDVPLTPLVFVAKAVCLALRRTPVLNARWDEPAGEIVYHDRVRLGIAAATPRGLIVPTIRDADTLPLPELAAALDELATTARAGRTTPADLTGGTFTITNVGVFGVDSGTPILNPGEAGILAVGAIKEAPWVVDGALAVRTVCQLALSFDHRLVDGEQGARFLADVGALLTEPGLALTW